MKFSFLSWNVRNYRGNPDRLSDADDLITSLNPDIFGLIEFRAKKDVRILMFDRFRASQSVTVYPARVIRTIIGPDPA